MYHVVPSIFRFVWANCLSASHFHAITFKCFRSASPLERSDLKITLKLIAVLYNPSAPQNVSQPISYHFREYTAWRLQITTGEAPSFQRKKK